MKLKGTMNTKWETFLRNNPWILPFAAGVIYLIIEIEDHPVPAIKHPMFWVETLLFAVLIPFITAKLFGRLLQVNTERDLIESELQNQFAFTTMVVGATEWDVVVDKIVRYPGSVLPVSNAFLNVYDIENNTYPLVASWGRDGKPAVEFEPGTLAENVNGYGKTYKMGWDEQFYRIDPGCTTCDHYRLPLIYGGFPVGFLQLDFSKGTSVSEDQLKPLGRLGSEMALVLENARLHKHPQNNGDLFAHERKRIARELHDTLGQNISILRFKLDLLNEQAPLVGIGDIQKELERMLSIASEANDQIRGTLQSLVPSQKDSLEDAISSLAAAAGDRSNFEVRFASSGEPKKLTPYVSRQVRFVFREALNNIEKHAHTDVVDVLLNWEENVLSLSVIDYGQGYTPKEAQKSNRYGLWIMHDRAASINAELEITSKPNHGTQVMLKVPIG